MSTSFTPEPEIEVERYELFAEPRYQFEPDRREFLQRVGDGIVVALVLGRKLVGPAAAWSRWAGWSRRRHTW